MMDARIVGYREKYGYVLNVKKCSAADTYTDIWSVTIKKLVTQYAFHLLTSLTGAMNVIHTSNIHSCRIRAFSTNRNLVKIIRLQQY